MKVTPLTIIAIILQVVIGFFNISKLGFYGNHLWQTHYLQFVLEVSIGLGIVVVLFKYKKVGIILGVGYMMYFVIRLYLMPIITGNID